MLDGVCVGGRGVYIGAFVWWWRRVKSWAVQRALFPNASFVCLTFLPESLAAGAVYESTMLSAAIKAALKVNEPAVDRVCGSGALTLEAAVAAVTKAGVKLSKCKLYHIHKSLVRPPLTPPVVVSRGVNSLTVDIVPHHPLFDVPATGFVVEVNGVAGPIIVPTAGFDTTRTVVPIPHVLQDLSRATEYTLRVHCVVEDPLMAGTLQPSGSVAIATLDPPMAPPAPVVVSCGVRSLVVRVANVGVASDPPSTGVVVEVDGGERPSAAAASGDGDVFIHVEHNFVVSGQQHVSLRARCTVSDAVVNASLPWSSVTETLMDLKVSGWLMLYICTHIHVVVLFDCALHPPPSEGAWLLLLCCRPCLSTIS